MNTRYIIVEETPQETESSRCTPYDSRADFSPLLLLHTHPPDVITCEELEYAISRALDPPGGGVKIRIPYLLRMSCPL